jgi:archaellum component FlaC
VEAFLSNILSSNTNVMKIKATHERLEAMENAIEMLENGMESVFRYFVKIRSHLLNDQKMQVFSSQVEAFIHTQLYSH